MYFILLSALCVYVCVDTCVYFDVWIWIVHACIYTAHKKFMNTSTSAIYAVIIKFEGRYLDNQTS